MYLRMKIHIAAATDIGRRTSNQDAVVVDEGLGLVVVSDGMGGYEGGEVASRLAIAAVLALVRRTATLADCTWPYPADLTRTSDENELVMAAQLASDEVAAQRHGRLAQMGATLAVARVRGSRATIAHVGDSRVYLVRGGRATALTRDHSLYEDLVSSGEAVPSRQEFRFGNVITRAIGIAGSKADVCEVEVVAGDLLVVCTDGLWDPVPEARLAEICSTVAPAAACAQLIDEALKRGGTDNITVAILAIQ
jgi:PPM family protein phosphatase